MPSIPARPYLVLVALWALYFYPLLLHPGRVLGSDGHDTLAEHLPAKLFLNRAWRETGELPLWNPYHFCGTPFVHDIQVGCFYPPYAVTYLVPEAAVGAALGWVVALHVLAAGVFAFAYARSHGLGEVGSLVAAAGFMLSAKWMTHLLPAGHTITVGLAWLPLVLLGLERGSQVGPARRAGLLLGAVRRVSPTIGSGVALAYFVLGTHPQWAFYAGVFAAAWTFPEDRTPRSLGRWLACGLGAVAVAVLLGAVQLLPTLEASRYSARTGGVEGSGALSLALPTFLGLVGPSLVNAVPQAWEVRGVFGACWLAAALAAPAVAGGRARRQLGVLLGLVFFSVGGAVLVGWLPGFSLFRVPGRMLLVAAFPLAYLAGVTTDSLVRSGWHPTARQAVRKRLGLVAAVGVLPALLVVLLDWWNSPGRVVWWPGAVGWLGLLLALPVAAWLLRARAEKPITPWIIVLLVELLAPTVLLPEARQQKSLYPESAAVRFLAEHAKPGEGRVLDRDVGGEALLGVGAPLALTAGVETVRGYNPLDVRHYREFLGFVAGDPGPVRGNNRFTQQVVPNFEVENPKLLDLLNVMYLAQPAADPPPAGWSGPVVVDDSPPNVSPLQTASHWNLPPHAVWENPTAFPRAFVVPEAAPMPVGHELDALQACDFRRIVLLTTNDPLPPNGDTPFRAVRITEYRPNRVRVELDDRGGFLVLADVWFPGWVCRIDGAEVPVYRANHAFRAVAIPVGAREAVFAFEPRSYRVGWWVSAAALAVVFLISSAYLLRALHPGRSGRIP